MRGCRSVGKTDDPEMNARIAERYSYQILMESIERLADTPIKDPIVTRRRRYMEDAKATWAHALKALDR